MMQFLVGWVSKLSGPMLVYIILALITTNAAQGWLLKKAWTKNAQAVLQCENAALRDAADANAEVSAELVRLKKEYEDYRAEIREVTAMVEAENEADRRAMEIEHEERLANLEVETDGIPDEEFFCASEPANRDQLNRMRDAATAYNENRIGDSH